LIYYVDKYLKNSNTFFPKKKSIWQINSTCKSDLCHVASVVGHTSPTKWNHT